MTGSKTHRRNILQTVDYRRGLIRIIDQTGLPREERRLDLDSIERVEEAIMSLRVRGAPAIGIAAAYGLLLALELELKRTVAGAPAFVFDRLSGVCDIEGELPDPSVLREVLRRTGKRLAVTRPTAVNLFWALERMRGVIERDEADSSRFIKRVAEEAFAIHEEELELELAIGEHGARLITDGMSVLTHCNAGGLATAGYGTALAVFRRAHEQGKRFTVYADETRPLLQGARLTVWELMRDGIDVTVLCDNAAASLLAAGRVDLVIVGADRIALNGDTANKIGTLGIAVLCEKFGKPFYVAAPLSSFDRNVETGAGIPIEERSADEVLCFNGVRSTPAGAEAYNPAFDVTPAGLVTGFITEKGILEQPTREKIAGLFRP